MVLTTSGSVMPRDRAATVAQPPRETWLIRARSKAPTWLWVVGAVGWTAVLRRMVTAL